MQAAVVIYVGNQVAIVKGLAISYPYGRECSEARYASGSTLTG